MQDIPFPRQTVRHPTGILKLISLVGNTTTCSARILFMSNVSGQWRGFCWEYMSGTTVS